MTDSIETSPIAAAPVAPRAPRPKPVRSRLNAWFFDVMSGYMHARYAALKSRLFADLPETIVEIGAGSGANFRYLRPGTRVIAIEPNPFAHASLERTAREHGVELTICGGGAEGIDLPDASVDAVVCSLVLCTVDEPDAVLQEIRRVLRPGGRFVCIEHVAAPAGSWIGRLQRWVLRPWRWIFEGCHTHRDTAAALVSAGFADVRIERFEMPTLFLPVRPQLAAVCTA